MNKFNLSSWSNACVMSEPWIAICIVQVQHIYGCTAEGWVELSLIIGLPAAKQTPGVLAILVEKIQWVPQMFTIENLHHKFLCKK